jgi:hypothetical protein
MLAGVRKQSSNYVADRRANTQRNIKDSDELECRQWRPPVSAARHSSFMKKEVVLPHRIKVPRLTVNVTCAWGASSTGLPHGLLFFVVTVNINASSAVVAVLQRHARFSLLHLSQATRTNSAQ